MQIMHYIKTMCKKSIEAKLITNNTQTVIGTQISKHLAKQKLARIHPILARGA